MAFIQWRRFDFFTYNFLDKKNDKTSQKLLPINEQESGENLDTFGKLKKIKITCSDSGRGQIVLGDQNGWIHKLDNNFEMDSFQAFDYEVITVQQIIQNPYLITSGSDESNKNVIKIWNQNKIDPHKQMPTCIRVIKNSSMNSVNCRITCLKATDALTFMCIGYNDGNLVTIRGDILREKSCKQKKIELCKDEITGVLLKGTYQNVSNNFLNSRLLPLNLRQNKQVTSFITTSRQVYFFEMKNEQECWNLIENEFGCVNGRSCCLINDGKHLDNCLFILGNKYAIYFYQSDGRGPCLAFNNEKLILHWFKGYLIVISKENLPFPVNLTDSIVANSTKNEKNMCTIYDIRNKYIAFSATFSSINQIFTEWGYIFVLLNDGRLVQIREKDMNSKLDLLFKKQQYSLAIELAKNQNFDSDNLTDIFKEYADHLYKKGDFENSINQYIKTIGKLEPSFVIRRYLDGQKVKNLTSYLYHLHEKGLANKDHTSLYLNCLTKSENTGELTNFLKNFDNKQSPNDTVKNQLLDVQNAISVLRKAKLYDQAIYLCEVYNCYDLYFKIQIEDKNNYLGAIQFIQTKLLDKKDVFLYFNQHLIVKYSKLLFREKPKETTELLKRICENMITIPSTDLNNEDKQKKSFFYIDILNSNPEKLIEFLEFLQERNGEFKETTISNTLLELYLQNYRASDQKQIKQELEDKILKLLKDHNNYDNERAMILCHVNKFTEGMKYLYEKLELYDILMLQCIECEDDQIIKICEKYGNRDPNLWVKGFLYFCKSNNSNPIREDHLLRTIDEITKRKLLPLISITNLLSTNKSLNLSMVKNYLINALAKENETITENEILIKQYKDETERIRKQIESIELNGKAFQSNKCSICNNFLDLPVVHFFCSHSFHQHCFQSHCGEDENNCPLCIQDQRKVLHLAELSQTIDNNELKDKFLKSINKSDSDSFTTVGNYFSKNLFNLN